MTTPDAHCDMCNQKFQPQRANKTGPRYCGNACRQRAHRRRSREAKLQGTPFGVTGVTLPPRAASDDPSVWVRLVTCWTWDPRQLKQNATGTACRWWRRTWPCGMATGPLRGILAERDRTS